MKFSRENQASLTLTLQRSLLNQWNKFLEDFTVNMSSVYCVYFHENFSKCLDSFSEKDLVQIPASDTAKVLNTCDGEFLFRGNSNKMALKEWRGNSNESIKKQA
jgi:hypothetical protein